MSQFTKTCEPSQPINSEQTESGRLILSPVAFPVRMYHAPALEKALKTAMDKLLGQGCGENTQESLANLDQNGLWQKMCEGCCQQVLISDREETSELFSGTWPTWGLMRSGRVTVLKPLVRRTKGKESLLWPTAVASDGAQGAVIGKDDTFYTTSTGMPRKVNRNGTDGSVGLGRLVQMWPTPLAGEWKDSGNIERLAEYADTKQLNLTRLVAKLTVQNWPTPSTQEIEHADCELTETGRRKSKNGDKTRILLILLIL